MKTLKRREKIYLWTQATDENYEQYYSLEILKGIRDDECDDDESVTTREELPPPNLHFPLYFFSF